MFLFLLAANINFFQLNLHPASPDYCSGDQLLLPKLIREVAYNAKLINHKVMGMRDQIQLLHNHYLQKHSLSRHQYKLISVDYVFYDNFDSHSPHNWDRLNARIDMVPASLLIAIVMIFMSLLMIYERY